MTTSANEPAEAASALLRTARTRTVCLALCLFVAPWFIVAANTGDSVMKLDGGDDTKPRDALALAADHLALDRWSNLAALIGALLLVPAILGTMRVVRVGAARLGLVAGVLMIAAYICYFAMVFQGYTVDAMVEVSGSTTQNADVLQATLDEPSVIWLYLLFVLGNFVGTFLMGIALIRARAVPRVAGYGLIGWPVLHLLGLPFFEVAGAVTQAIGLALVARVLLRRSPDETASGESQPYELLRK